MADVTLTYKGSAILELSDSGQKSIDTAGTYCDANIILDYVKPSGGTVQFKSGTYTPTQDYTTDGNRKLTTTEVVGFTPDIFILCIDDKSTVSGTSGAILQSIFAKISSAGNAYRATARYANTSNTIGGIFDGSNWTSSSAGQLYMNSGTGDIYYHTNQNYKLIANKNYSWFAFKLPSS